MYKIIGNDGREYGPIGIEQIRLWITQYRVNAQTLTQSEGSAEWKPLISCDELAPELKFAPVAVAVHGSNRRVKPWMFTYTIFFALISVMGVLDDFYNIHYYTIYCMIIALIFVVIFAGNLLYSFSFITQRIRTLWKFIFPIVILQFLATGLVDQFIGSDEPTPFIEASIIWLVVLGLYIPTFWAHYKIGYGNSRGKSRPESAVHVP